MHLKLNRDIETLGFDGSYGVDYVDEGNMYLGEEEMGSSLVRNNIKIQQAQKQAQAKKMAMEKAAKNAVLQKAKFEQQKKQLAQQKAKIKTLNMIGNKSYLKARKEPVLGREFTSLMGSPWEGFGTSESYLQDGNLRGEGAYEKGILSGEDWNNNTPMGWGLPKFSPPKLPAIKISPPKISPPKLPTISQVTSAVSRVVAAPLTVGAHIVKQVGGSQVEKALKSATGISVTEIARGGDAGIREIAKAGGKVISAPVDLTHKIMTQVGGHKLENFLNKVTGNTYSQAIAVGKLPGRALAGEAITQKDWDQVGQLALKAAVAAAVVYGAGGLSELVLAQVKNQAAGELSKKIGGSAGSVLAGISALSTGDVSGAAQTIAQEEAKRVAMEEVSKKVGKDAAAILSVGASSFGGGSSAMVQAATQKATDVAKQKALEEVSKATGVPVQYVSMVQAGKVPTTDELKKAMHKELIQAPERLKAEVDALPAKIAQAPAATKKVLEEKRKLLQEEISNRDKTVAKLLNEHSKKLAEYDDKIRKGMEAIPEKEKVIAQLQADIHNASIQKKSQDEINRLIDRLNAANEDLARADVDLLALIADKENEDVVFEAKEFSAASGIYGVRTNSAGEPLSEAKEVFVATKEYNETAHPLLVHNLISGKA